MSRITFEKIGKSYGDVEVIKDLSLQIADEEFLVLVGPSGCGKSTALRMIAGLEDVSSGKLMIGDQLVNELPPKERNVAMVFQSYALYPHMSVYDNIAFGLKIKKVSPDEIKKRVSEAAKTLQLEAVLDRRPKALSGGQRQRVALGRVMVRSASVFLFDEPLSNLDAELRVSMRAEIAQLQRRFETTTVYVTHDQTEAMTMGDRVAVLAPLDRSDGQSLMQVGAPLDLYNKPQNVFVARFIGTPKMNLLEVQVDADQRMFVFGAARIGIPEGYELGPLSKSGSSLLLGFRPEHISATAAEHWIATARISGRVELVETLGHEMVVHFTCEGEAVSSKLSNRATPPAVGDNFEAFINLARLHLFDPSTQKRLPDLDGS